MRASDMHTGSVYTRTGEARPGDGTPDSCYGGARRASDHGGKKPQDECDTLGTLGRVDPSSEPPPQRIGPEPPVP